MNPAKLADICSHANPTIRKGCGNAAPLAMAKLVLPQALFDELGLREIPPQNVIGTPGILYRE